MVEVLQTKFEVILSIVTVSRYASLALEICRRAAGHLDNEVKDNYIFDFVIYEI